MKLFNRNNITAGFAALMITATAALSSPAQAASNPAPAPAPVAADPSTYVAIMVSETADSNIYYAPGQLISNSSMVYAGENWFVLGQDSTGAWVELYIDPVTSVWVPKSVMALNPSTPLPIISTGS